MKQAIKLQNVSFAYQQNGSSKQKPVLKNASLQIAQGGFAVLMGRTGCGKTTLLQTLNGIVPKLLKGYFEGSVAVDGQDVSQKTVQEMSKHVAFVFQDPNDQIFSLTAREEVAFALKLQGLDGKQIQKRVAQALKTVGLTGFQEQDPTTLSQGQKQKLAIATALAMNTPILVLDEPIASLDYSSALQTYAILSKLNKQGTTILAAEHDSEFAYAHADKIMLMDGGQIVAQGGKALLRSRLMQKLGLRRLK